MLKRELLDSQLRSAIAGKRLIEVGYKGGLRLAEPHDYGIQNGNQRLLVYQLRGPARPGRPAIGWRLLDVDKIESCTVLDTVFAGSRGPAHAHHMAWDVVYARVK